MTNITILLVIVAVCFLAAATGFGKLVKVVKAEKGEITSEIEYELHKELTDNRKKFNGFADVIDKDIEQNATHPYRVVKQWYDNLHCTSEQWTCKTAADALECASDDNIGKTYEIVNIIQLDK